mgnify:CR=1 FL=1
MPKPNTKRLIGEAVSGVVVEEKPFFDTGPLVLTFPWRSTTPASTGGPGIHRVSSTSLGRLAKRTTLKSALCSSVIPKTSKSK